MAGPGINTQCAIMFILVQVVVLLAFYSLYFGSHSSPIAASLDLGFGLNKDSYSTLPIGTRYSLERSPPNLPSVLLSEEEEKSVAKLRGIYGGKRDKSHLGGFTTYDEMGLSNNTFNFMLGGIAVKSFIDVGCGRGFSTKYFLDNGAKVLCVEGSHDAVLNSVLPPEVIVEHDFSRGPWWPEETYDAAWAVEFLEHVGRGYMRNYLPIFHQSAYIFVTASAWGGWHHVEVHPPYWWRSRMEAQGFVYAEKLTEELVYLARKGKDNLLNISDNYGQHIKGMSVYINPRVASLPRHSHLMGGNGCFVSVLDGRDGGAPCEHTDALHPYDEALLSCSIVSKKKYVCEKNARAKNQFLLTAADGNGATPVIDTTTSEVKPGGGNPEAKIRSVAPK